MRLLITGGAGFIGSNLVHHWLREHPDDVVSNLDALTYAGNLANLKEIQDLPNYRFVHADLRDPEAVRKVFQDQQIEHVIHLAAESHVDRSISGPADFIETNVRGTFNLLEAAREFWQPDLSSHRFHHVSTDEVFGSLGPDGFFTETTPYAPNSPYSASKAASDHLVRAWHHTYGMNVVTTNCSNNYGPFHFPEKLIPLIIRNCLERQALPVYGDGGNVRDWLFVEDHCSAIDTVFHQGREGEVYAIGGHNEWRNIDIVRLICQLMDERLSRSGEDSCERLITFVKDRPGHDQRYAIDASKVKRELGWVPAHTFEEGIAKTIHWYLEHPEWIQEVTSGAYLEYYAQQYGA
ncbi:MAG: dTDP-glucose 4,6-dehydratase [bacterium]